MSFFSRFPQNHCKILAGIVARLHVKNVLLHFHLLVFTYIRSIHKVHWSVWSNGSHIAQGSSSSGTWKNSFTCCFPAGTGNHGNQRRWNTTPSHPWRVPALYSVRQLPVTAIVRRKQKECTESTFHFSHIYIKKFGSFDLSSATHAG